MQRDLRELAEEVTQPAFGSMLAGRHLSRIHEQKLESGNQNPNKQNPTHKPSDDWFCFSCPGIITHL